MRRRRRVAEMDSFHATVMQRPEQDEEAVRRENGATSSLPRPPYDQLQRSPIAAQPDYHLPPISHSTQFSNHPSTPSALPMPSHIPPTSPRTYAPPTAYVNEYQAPAREISSASGYYDPTSDSRERRPSDNTWRDIITPQVRS